MTKERVLLFATAIYAGLIVKSQIVSADLQQYLIDEKKISVQSFLFYPDIKKFYTYQNFEAAWMNDSKAQTRTLLLNLLQLARQLGLNEKDYIVRLPRDLLEGTGPAKDSMLAEIQLTDAALHYFHDVVYGNTSPKFGYNGLNYQPNCIDISLLLSTYLKADQLNLLVKDMELHSPQYIAIKKAINRFDSIIHVDNYKDIPVRSSSIVSTNIQLLRKLQQLNILDAVSRTFYTGELKEKIIEAQKLFGLLPDGVLRSNLIKELNIPLEIRIEELKQSLNTLRWLNCMVNNEPVIVVNIPSATLQVYKQGKIILESKIIVGKRTTPTPTLISKVNELILYPYWMVPHSIAVKELLPAIKRNPSFINSNGYQVLNKNGKVVNPNAIDWHTLGSGNFPYTIRQSTGCDNSLGLVKLNFYNPYSVYLHDTPSKSLFNASKRYFSHGCMRVEKAMELAHLLLADNTIAVDTLEEKGCLRNQSPIVVPALLPMNVIVLYNTAWFNAAGELSFSEDIYKRNSFVRSEEWLSRNN
jgi:murein L,D-transpeptidase YcbB/YkuD